MTTSFLIADNEELSLTASPDNSLESSSSNKELVRLLIIGSRKGVNSIIHTLYSLGFAEVSEWSPLLPSPNPGEVMSILTRSIIRS